MIHEVAGSPKEQSADEVLVYSIVTTEWGSNPTNTPSVAGDVITLSPLKSLTRGHDYRVEVKFIIGSNTWECFFVVKCSF